MVVSVPMIITTICVTILVTVLTIILNRSLRKKKYDVLNKKIELDEVRASLEKQIYVLNDRIVQNEERWRDVNHLLLRKELLDDRQTIFTDKKIYYSDFLKANGIFENELKIDEKLIFVLTPFHDDHAEEFLAIRDVCTNLGYNCIRGDEIFFERDIFPQMLKYIVNARLVIANINGRNPNVLYELGIAHALDKAVLHVSRQPENLPIDIKSKQFFIYKKLDELQEFIRKELLNGTKI